METIGGIPFKNIITTKVMSVDQGVIKALYPDHVVIIMPTGWETYHVIVEDGQTQLTEHRVMTNEEIEDNFNIDVNEY